MVLSNVVQRKTAEQKKKEQFAGFELGLALPVTGNTRRRNALRYPAAKENAGVVRKRR